MGACVGLLMDCGAGVQRQAVLYCGLCAVAAEREGGGDAVPDGRGCVAANLDKHLLPLGVQLDGYVGGILPLLLELGLCAMLARAGEAHLGSEGLGVTDLLYVYSSIHQTSVAEWSERKFLGAFEEEELAFSKVFRHEIDLFKSDSYSRDKPSKRRIHSVEVNMVISCSSCNGASTCTACPAPGTSAHWCLIITGCCCWCDAPLLPPLLLAPDASAAEEDAADNPCRSRAIIRRLMPANFPSSCPATSSIGTSQLRSSPHSGACGSFGTHTHSISNHTSAVGSSSSMRCEAGQLQTALSRPN